MSQRRLEQEAEENVLERLNKSGLLSPPGEIDKVLETVVNNLEVTNGITIEPPVRDRSGYQNARIFGSAHANGVNMLYCDGHVSTLRSYKEVYLAFRRKLPD